MSFMAAGWLWGLTLVPLVFWLTRSLGQAVIDRHSAWVSKPLWKRVGYRVTARPLHAVLLAGVLALLLLTLAQPRWGHSEQMISSHGVDVVFVIDSSLSMAAEDLKPNRLAVAKSIIRRMIGELRGDRLGLVQAEGEGVVLAPLTFDAAMIDLLLDAVAVATLPKPGTRLSEALSVAIDLFDEHSEGSAVLVVLSDGEDHGRNLEPFARRVAERGIVVLAGGVGSPQGVPIPIETAGTRDFKRDAVGQVVISQLHEESLEVLARETDGEYRRLDDASADIGGFFDVISSLERRQREELLSQQREERFQWPLFGAVALLVGFLALDPFGREVA